LPPFRRGGRGGFFAPIGAGIVSALAILLIGLFLYREILFPPTGERLYPWGSDTLGHVFRGEYLGQKLDQGDLYPTLLPDWYLGTQLLRYYPPLPYYLQVGLNRILNDPVAAINGLIYLCAALGGLSWLLYRRWIGWLPALAGGILYLFLPDNVRVALAEGNTPRAVCTAILPLAVYCLLMALEENPRLLHRLGLALCFAAIVLSHAMMAAIYGVCCALLVFLYLFSRKVPIGRAVWTVGCMGLGLMLAGWWLLPSLTGGITALNASAMTEALTYFSLSDYFNPLIRQGNPEVVYVGTALLLLAAAMLVIRSGRDGLNVALTLTGLFGVLITTDGFNQFFNALPLHNLLWPLRFLGAASFFLLLAGMGRLAVWGKRSPWIAIVVVAALALDGAGSLFLIHLRPLDSDLLPTSQKLASSAGWREATLDLSRLGSGPSYYFSALGGREQVYGWAYQGAQAARTVAALNEALELGDLPYLIDRLNLLGVDDVVLLNELVVAQRLEGDLLADGFQVAYRGARTTLYHRDGGPRAYLADWPVLGIGRGAQNLAYLFPLIKVGRSPRLDDYSFAELAHYKTLVLSGFSWRDRTRAEDLAVQLAKAGVQVVVDLTGVPEDPVASIPRFLGVWGENIILGADAIRTRGSGGVYDFQAFGSRDQLWYCHTPQGLQTETMSFDYLGENATVAGYNQYDNGRVWFLGLNLPYHAALTRDPGAIRLLADLLQLNPDRVSDYTAVALADYNADQNGYRFRFRLDRAATLFLPVAYHEGMVLSMDGKLVPLDSFELMAAFAAPGGEHTVELRFLPTTIHWLGGLVSGLGVMALAGLWAWMKGWRPALRPRVGLFVIVALVLIVSPVMAAGAIVLDGQFGDWAGMPNIADPSGDASAPQNDLTAFYFATNPGEEKAYFMAERGLASSDDFILRLAIDTDNDGVYNEPNDRVITINYWMVPPKSKVEINLYDGTGQYLKSVAKNVDWGETRPGRRVEWGVSFVDLGIVPNQTLRMILTSLNGSNPDDSTSETQWSPADALGWPLIVLLVLAGSGWLAWQHRKTL
jgi:uncharacterized membrane protein